LQTFIKNVKNCENYKTFFNIIELEYPGDVRLGQWLLKCMKQSEQRKYHKKWVILNKIEEFRTNYNSFNSNGNYMENADARSKNKYSFSNGLVHGMPSKFIPKVKNVLIELFNRFASIKNGNNNESIMTMKDFKAYFVACLEKHPHTSPSYVTNCTNPERLYKIFRLYSPNECVGSVSNYKMSLKGFLSFYREAAIVRPEHVWWDLNSFGYKRKHFKE